MTEPFYRLPPDLASDIDDYAHAVQRFTRGDLAPNVFKAARVPRGVYEQRQNGVYMARVRVAGGTLSLDQVQALAALGSEFGNGLLHVTTRQDVQIHDLRIEDTPAVMRRLMAVGLTTKGGGGNTVRNITACPYAGICAAERFDVTPCAHAVTEQLIPLVGSYNLPRKYKIAFSGCPCDCAMAQVADLGFVADVRDGQPGFRVFAGGGMGAHSRIADLFADWIPATEILRTAEAMRRLFDRFGDRTNKHKARLRFVFERLGKETVRTEFHALLPDVEKDVPAWEQCSPVNGDADTAPDTPPVLELADGIRPLRQRQDGFVAVPLHLPLGFIAARDFARIGEIAGEFSEEGGIRTTRYQNLLMRFVRTRALRPLADALRTLDIDVLSPAPLEHFVACAGASTCRLGLCLSRNAVRECAAALAATGLEESLLDGLRIYVNGCPNACGHQPIGPVGLFGSALRTGGHLVPCYRITLGGRCDQHGARLGQALGQVPAKALPAFLRDLALDFQAARTGTEGFSDYVDRMGLDHFAPLLEHHAGIPPHDERPDVYRDWGEDEAFSLAGRGAGECGAGVFDVIQDDLAAARSATTPFDALLAATRALLITRGVDARDPAAVIGEFEKYFVDTGLVSEEFRGLLDRTRGHLQGWQQAFEGCEDTITRLVDRVELLFSTLDANLKFHPPDAEHKEEPTAPAPRSAASIELDLRGVACPMNFVKAKLKLEDIAVGETLAVVLDDGEPVRNVPASFRQEGHTLLQTEDLGDGHWRVVIKKMK